MYLIALFLILFLSLQCTTAFRALRSLRTPTLNRRLSSECVIPPAISMEEYVDIKVDRSVQRGMEKSMSEIRGLFSKLDVRIDKLDDRIDKLDVRLTDRIDKLDDRIDKLGSRLDSLEGHLTQFFCVWTAVFIAHMYFMINLYR